MPIGLLHFALLIVIQSALAKAGSLDSSKCAKDAKTTYWRALIATDFRDRHGQPTSDMSKVWGIGYGLCKKLCEDPENGGFFNWEFSSTGISSWLLPWLALTAQLPFANRDRISNIMTLFLGVGSPALITYSLALTIFNSRSINRKFRHVKDHLDSHIGIDTIRAVRSFLTQSQHVPLQFIRCDLHRLIVCPKSWAWWNGVRDDLQATKRGWSFYLYAQVGWVAVAQFLAILDFFTTQSLATNVGVGLAINSLWIWMIPVVLGWVKIGTQQSAESIQDAINKNEVPDAGGSNVSTGGHIGVSDKSSFDDDFIEEARPSSQAPLPSEKARYRSLTSNTFLGFSIDGCALEAGPIFTYARVWNHLAQVKIIFRGFNALNKQLIARRTVSNRPWTEDPLKWTENLQGSPEQMARYIGMDGSCEEDIALDTTGFTEVYHSCAVAALMAMALQWGSTGAAIAIAYK